METKQQASTWKTCQFEKCNSNKSYTQNSTDHFIFTRTLHWLTLQIDKQEPKKSS